MIGLLLALAQAADPPSCTHEFQDAPASISVAWVSPSGKTVGRNGQVTVVSTSDLRAWVKSDSGGSVARMLQRLGLRGKKKDPSRPWKVVIFDVEARDLCRPVAGHDDPVAIAGLVSCKPRPSKPSPEQTGCGQTVDRASGAPGFEQFRGSWADLARNGFCVLPADRFVDPS